MPAPRRESSPAEQFVRDYARPLAEAERLVELEVFGAPIVANGYTTPAEATDLIARLALRPGKRLLEIGSGRGWPGPYLARRSGYAVVLTDVPLAAPRESREEAQRLGVGGLSVAAAADGTALPFGPVRFDAVVHTDVLC